MERSDFAEESSEISPPSATEERDSAAASSFDFKFNDFPGAREQISLPNYPIRKISVGDETILAPEMNFRELETDVTDTTTLTHGIHKHPAIFIPQIPRHLIRSFTTELNEDGERPVILDPFSGSGTTGVEAKIAGRDYIGIEINPLSKLVSDVATTPIPYTIINRVKKEVASEIESTSTQYYEDYDVEFLDRTEKDHWFKDEAIDDLTTVRKVVSEYCSQDIDLTRRLERRERKVVQDQNLSNGDLWEQVERWLILMIANTVFDVSNADPGVSKAHKSKKMRKLIDENQHPPDATEKFLHHLESSASMLIDLWNEIYQTNVPGGSSHSVNVDGNENSTLHKFSDNWADPTGNYAHQAEVDIRLDDARSFSVEKSADMAITSPPYINAMNYYRGTKLRLFWIQDLLEGVSDLDADELRRSIVGTNSVSLSDAEHDLPVFLSDIWTGSDDAFNETSLPELDTDIKQIHEGDLSESTSLAYITWRFFAEDMVQVLTRVYEHLKPGGYFFFVIGENTISGRRIQSHKFIADIATNLGKFGTHQSDLNKNDGYHHIGTAWDEITNRDLFQGRDHGSGVIEAEWIIVLQKPRR